MRSSQRDKGQGSGQLYPNWWICRIMSRIPAASGFWLLALSRNFTRVEGLVSDFLNLMAATRGRRSSWTATVLPSAAVVAVCVAAVSAQQTVFRSKVDVIAVDVQVVDGEGYPIGRIGPDAFSVTINGQRRKVVSAQFVAQQPANDDPAEPTPPEGRGRTFVLAIDSGSFEVGAERAPIQGAQTFVQRLDPT